ncbi:MAG: diaminopimelate decarboxylase, partial [Clostridia bacterium]|nr:diaminopimelate decarboxylase [Clostridia bacterium]
LKELNLGGGFGITYTEEDAPLEPKEYLQTLASRVIERCNKEGIEPFDIVIEPGRSLVGEGGITLYTVGSIKDIKGIRKYISVDGGMGDNPRYALYQAKYSALIANRADEQPKETVTVAGRCCESGDMLIYDIKLPVVKSGDILAVLATGAYNYSMASNYNRLPVPAVVLCKDGKDDLIVKPQSFEDIIRNDVIPGRLK